jgi:hypothetical protein
MPDTVVERTDSGSSTGMILGIVVVLLIAVMAFFFILGPGRGTPPTGQTNVNVPGQQAQPQAPGAPNIQVPRQIDVNVNQGGGQQAPAPGN